VVEVGELIGVEVVVVGRGVKVGVGIGGSG